MDSIIPINSPFIEHPIYIIVGHGCDIENADGSIQLLPIPPHITYITSTSCGLGSSVDKFKDMLQDIQQDNPTIHLSTNKIHHIDSRKNSYVNNKITLFTDSPFFIPDAICMIQKSGIYTQDTIRGDNNIVVMTADGQFASITYFIKRNVPGKIYTNIDYDGVAIRGSDGVPCYLSDLFRLSYNGSIYPTVEQVVEVYKDILLSDYDLLQHNELFVDLLKEDINDDNIDEFYSEIPNVRWENIEMGTCEEIEQRIMLQLHEIITDSDISYHINSSNDADINVRSKLLARLFKKTKRKITERFSINVSDLFEKYQKGTFIHTACRVSCDNEIGEITDSEITHPLYLHRQISDREAGTKRKSNKNKKAQKRQKGKKRNTKSKKVKK